MSNTSMEKDEEENLTSTDIFDILKSKGFQKELFGDMLSHLKDMHLYKDMRAKVEKLTKQKAEALSNAPSDIDRISIAAELSSVAYVVDIIFSKLLYTKLENEIKNEVMNIIKVLRSEGKIPDDVWANINTKGEDTKEMNNSSERKTENPTPVKMKIPSVANSKKLAKLKNVTKSGEETSLKRNMKTRSKAVLKKAAPVSLSSMTKKNMPCRKPEIEEQETPTKRNTRSTILRNEKSVQENQSNVKQLSTKKGTGSKKSSLKGNVSTEKNRSNNWEDIKSVSPKNYSRNKNLTDRKDESPKQDMNEKNDVLNAESSFLTNNEDSDSESVLSVGDVSVASVSSVHTSDLSSFDDEISLSSEDEEGAKKRLSLKHLMTQLNSTSLTVTEESDIDKTPKKDFGESSKKTSEVTDTESSTSSGISKRIRKPNSRYSSDIIICPSLKVKDRKKQPTKSTKNVNQKNSELFLKRKRSLSDKSDTEEEKTSNKIQKIDCKEEENHISEQKELSKINETSQEVEIPGKLQEIETSKENTTLELNKQLPMQETDMEVENPPDVENSPKESAPSELPKPQPPVLLTSRRTAPVTLYST